MNGPVDSEGWTYGNTFKSTTWHETGHKLDWVRKRKWIRMRARNSSLSQDDLTGTESMDMITSKHHMDSQQGVYRKSTLKKSGVPLVQENPDLVIEQLRELECDTDKMKFILKELATMSEQPQDKVHFYSVESEG
jgi:hypothetical protein